MSVSKLSLNSKRKYKVQISELGQVSTLDISLLDLVNIGKDEYEFIYALADIIDSVLDLREGTCMYFNPCRDNEDVKGIITRTV